MRKLGVAVIAVLLVLLAGSTRAGADPVPTTPPADLHECTLPGSAPYWFDFADGSVPFWQLFAKPGVIAAVPNLNLPEQIRAQGGTTVYFDLHLKGRVGLPSQPVDPATIDARADKFFLYVQNSTHCSNPVIAENELYGAGLAAPWSATNRQYRANVLRFLTRLRELGGQPWLLVNSSPYTADEAGDWWRSVAQVAGFVREIYFPAPLISAQGAVLGSRTLRTSFRRGVLEFTQMGIPTAKMGIFVGFQTTRGTGGREGLKPATAWFETVKWQALAAKQISKEMSLNGIWSWGWAEYRTSPAEMDPDKPRAACVYLWARDPKLCNGPSVAGKKFNRSRTEGQLSLPGNVRCTIGRVGNVRWSSVRSLLALTGDPDLAFTHTYTRALEQRSVRVGAGDVLEAERSIISRRFGGSSGAYRSALAQARVSLGVARGVIADELRRARIESHFSATRPSAAAVAEFQQTYGDLQVRLVETSGRAPWLGGAKVGYALESNAPGALMGLAANRWTSVWSATGVLRVRPLGPPLPLGSLSGARVNRSIRAALVAQSRDARYPAWIAAQESGSFPRAVCWRDLLPEVGMADLTSYLPFLEF